jgi:uncharacterized protein
MLLPSLAAAAPAMWTVRDRDSEIVLFGSVHVLPEGVAWRTPALDRAVAEADDLWFETELDPAGLLATQRESSARGFLPSGERLSKKLSKPGRERLARLCAELKLPLAKLDAMRPWYAELTLAAASYQASGAHGARGVEREIAALARPGARVVALETPAQQVALFADAPESDQLASLERTLAQIDASPGDYRRMVRAWAAGDLRALDRQALAPLRRAAPRLYAALVARRNAEWADRITQRLKGSGRTVVVVGAGHLIGHGGVPALLRARGVEVDGPH